jgi:predicted amidohydrolase YtcJ
MLPGFVDAHSHLASCTYITTFANLLPRPDATVNSFSDLLTVLNKWIAGNSKLINEVGWIMGLGYDDSNL